MSILVVDDDVKISQRVAEKFLTNAGHKVVKAENGRQAIEQLQNHRIDLILMDIRMPVMDGIQATRSIRQLDDREKANVPIVALTADVVKERLEECLASGMQGVITKPVDLEELNRIILREVLKTGGTTH